MRLHELGHSRFFAPSAIAALALLAACGSDPGPRGDDGACASGDGCEVEVTHGDGNGAPARTPQPIEVVEYERPNDPHPSTCTDGYANADCRRPGLPVDIGNATPCCGLPTREATCCATAGQRCSNELGETCCNGLRCGVHCTCE